MTTVWIYIDTTKQVGSVDYLKVLTLLRPRTSGSRRTTPKALLLNMRCWSELKRDE